MLNVKAIECLQCPVSKALGDELFAAKEMSITLDERVTKHEQREFALEERMRQLEGALRTSVDYVPMEIKARIGVLLAKITSNSGEAKP